MLHRKKKQINTVLFTLKILLHAFRYLFKYFQTPYDFCSPLNVYIVFMF